MDNMSLIKKLPPMLSGGALEQALSILPEYNPEIANENEAVRLIALSDLYKVFVPNQMSREIYCKLYLALLRSLQKKESKLVVEQYMERTKYLSTRGNKRFVALLSEDFNHYYKDLPKNTLSETWQMEKIFSNYRCHTYDVCLLAMFLNVPVAELVDMSLPEKSQAQQFDEQIKLLHDQGLNYRQISERLGASYDFCKLIGGGRKKKGGYPT